MVKINLTKAKKENITITLQTTNQCPLCANSKSKDKPFYSSINKSKAIFELIHMDMIGPIPNSIYGSKYFFTILDDFS